MKQLVDKAVAALGLTFAPNRKMEIAKVWEEMLDDIDVDAALRTWLRSHSTFPTVADLRLTSKYAEHPTPSAGWAQVVALIDAVEHGSEVRELDSLVLEARRISGVRTTTRADREAWQETYVRLVAES